MPEKDGFRKRLGQKRHTVAVILIHGIGEQRPMETLRGFVDAVLPDPPQGGEKFFSRPDPLSESFELRRLQNRTQPRVQFFEYYWAYKSEGATFSHLWSWLSTLLLRRPGRVPSQLRIIWYLSWILVAVILAGLVLGVSDRLGALAGLLSFPPALLSGGGALLLTVLQGAVLNYMGDAARYLSPMPQNILLRQEIRSDGIQLLKRIQEAGEYDRVVLVGHSLGSVIAYDILRHAWQEYSVDYRLDVRSGQPALTRLEAAGERLREHPGEAKLQEYRDAQVELWKELRDLGSPWLVTDLISIGSPLAHAALLLAGDEEDLWARQRQRELPTAPPQPEMKPSPNDKHNYSYIPWKYYGKSGKKKLYALHSGAVFACTRWTNLYFPARGGLFGDLVGGPLQKWFGPGIRDIPVKTGRFLTDNTLTAHLAYWPKPNEKTASSEALAGLITALDLGNTNYYRSDNDAGSAADGAVDEES